MKTAIGVSMGLLLMLLVLGGMAYTMFHEGYKLCVWTYDKIFRAPIDKVYIASQSNAYHNYKNCKGLIGTSGIELVNYDIVYEKRLEGCSYCESDYEKKVSSWINYTNEFLEGFRNLDYSWHKSDSDQMFTLELRSNGKPFVCAIAFFRENDWTGRNDKQLSHITIYSSYDASTRYDSDYCRQLSILYDLGLNFLNSRGVITPDEWTQVSDESTKFLVNFMSGEDDLGTYHRFKSGGGGGIFVTDDDGSVMISFDINE